MCNLYTLRGEWEAIVQGLREGYDLEMVDGEGQALRGLNVAVPETLYPKYQGLFLRPADPAAAEGVGPVTPTIGRWGLVPAFFKDGPKAWKAATNNARSEDMAAKASFRDAYKKRRALIPATSWCEWTGPKGSMTKHAIGRADGQLLLLAGLWGRSPGEPRDDGAEPEWVDSYTMVMQAAGPDDFAGRYHNRQPVVLDAAGARAWLDLSADPTPLFRSPPAGVLTADPLEPVAA